MTTDFDINKACALCDNIYTHDYIVQCATNLELIDSPELAWDYILKLRNENSNSFIEQHEISKEEHYNFMEKYGKDYFIFHRMCNGCKCGSCLCPVGFIGIVDGDIRLCTDSKYRREGVSVEMLEFVRNHFPVAFGKVKKDNIASQKAFEKVGYNESYSDDSFIYYIMNDRGN